MKLLKKRWLKMVLVLTLLSLVWFVLASFTPLGSHVYSLWPIQILLTTVDDCQGSSVYIDGRHAFTIGKDTNYSLWFRHGWHLIEARKSGYRSARVRFWTKDYDQFDYTGIELSRKNTGENRALIIRVVDYRILH